MKTLFRLTRSNFKMFSPLLFLGVTLIGWIWSPIEALASEKEDSCDSTLISSSATPNASSNERVVLQIMSVLGRHFFKEAYIHPLRIQWSERLPQYLLVSPQGQLIYYHEPTKHFYLGNYLDLNVITTHPRTEPIQSQKPVPLLLEKMVLQRIQPLLENQNTRYEMNLASMVQINISNAEGEKDLSSTAPPPHRPPQSLAKTLRYQFLGHTIPIWVQKSPYSKNKQDPLPSAEALGARRGEAVTQLVEDERILAQRNLVLKKAFSILNQKLPNENQGVAPSNVLAFPLVAGSHQKSEPERDLIALKTSGGPFFSEVITGTGESGLLDFQLVMEAAITLLKSWVHQPGSPDPRLHQIYLIQTNPRTTPLSLLHRARQQSLKGLIEKTFSNTKIPHNFIEVMAITPDHFIFTLRE